MRPRITQGSQSREHGRDRPIGETIELEVQRGSRVRLVEIEVIDVTP